MTFDERPPCSSQIVIGKKHTTGRKNGWYAYRVLTLGKGLSLSIRRVVDGSVKHCAMVQPLAYVRQTTLVMFIAERFRDPRGSRRRWRRGSDYA